MSRIPLVALCGVETPIATTRAGGEPARCTRRSGGLTLLEVLAVVFLTSVMISVALDFYVELSRNTERAAAHTAAIRRATAILDRVARDFERTVLLRKAPEEDPLAHPWVFVEESRASQLGADHVKFPTLHHVARSSQAHEADFSMVAYLTRAGPDQDVELLRWSSPRLPESLDRDFPLPEDEGVLLLADGLADFGVRFMGPDAEWTDRWDSSTLVDSGEIPLAVEVEVALANDRGFFGDEDFARFSRLVLLPLRPLDPADLSPEPQAENGGSAAAEPETAGREGGQAPDGGAGLEGSGDEFGLPPGFEGDPDAWWDPVLTPEESEALIRRLLRRGGDSK